MKKGLQEGFTLSELLITLAVVGVVAAITIPQLVTGLSKKQTGSQLSRTVSQIELGCQNLIQYENSKVTDGSYINSLSAVPNLSVQKLAPFIGAIDSDESVSTGNIKDYAYMTAPLFMQSAYAIPKDNEAEYDNTIDDTEPGVPLPDDEEKDEAVFEGESAVEGANQGNEDSTLQSDNKVSPGLTGDAPTTSTDPDAANKVVLQFLIDVNGSDKKPNAYGKDIFEFSLTDSCKVVPYGLKTYKTDCVKGNVTDGRACAARVVADGWKIKY